MNRSAFSVSVFGAYLLASGLALAICPNLVLGLLGFPGTGEIWIRVVGMLTFNLGFFFTQAARKGLADFFRWTVYVRLWVFACFTAVVLLGMAKPAFLLFGCIDLIGALWTASALRGEKPKR